MNRSIQSEGTFGISKQDRGYKRMVRKGLKAVTLEAYIIAIGYNLYKYHNKQKKKTRAKIRQNFKNSIF